MRVTKREAHDPVEMWQARYSDYVYKGYVGAFVCGVCGRQVRKHLNYLGRRRVFCNGLKTFAS